MRVFGSKSVSVILYWIFVSCFALMVLFTVLTLYSYFQGDYSLDNYTGTPIILNSMFEILPKAVSFLLLIFIFKSFKSNTIFNSNTLWFLNAFAVFSLGMPIIKALFNYYNFKSEIDFFSINEVTLDILSTMFSGLLIGVFAAYIAAIFKRGFHLKEENDLTI